MRPYIVLCRQQCMGYPCFLLKNATLKITNCNINGLGKDGKARFIVAEDNSKVVIDGTTITNLHSFRLVINM